MSSSSRSHPPWEKLIPFHKEIVSRAEQGFFSFDPLDEESERFSFLDDFEPTDLAGPWAISLPGVRSAPFCHAVQQRKAETVFLGGPWYVAAEREMGRTWSDRLRPILYRELTVIWKGDSLALAPAQGNWSLSPLFFGLLDRLSTSLPDTPEAFVRALLERAGSDLSLNPALSQILRSALIGLLPDLKAELNKPFKRSGATRRSRMPSPWLLFAPPTGATPLTQDLLRDYDRILAKLALPEPQLGGLKLLRHQDHTLEDVAEARVANFVPLNRAQRDAVQAVLKGDPLTVISGPPGTGKSQVVVSLLLNAWANGKSVLFASQNNKAVDVVRERLERFESDFPVAVRAGATRYQNICEVLGRTLTIAAAAAKGRVALKEADALAKEAQELEKQLAALAAALESGLPQRVEEAFRAALEEYSKHLSLLQQLADHRKTLRDEAVALGLGSKDHQETRKGIADARAWLARIAQCQAQVAADEARRAEMVHAVRTAESQRENTAAEIGLAAADAGDWSWADIGPSIEVLAKWEHRFRSLVTNPQAAAALEPSAWDREYERWSTADSARQTAERARTFGDTLTQTLGAVEQDVSIVAKAQLVLEGKRSALLAQALPEEISVPPELLDEWMGAYTELITRSPSVFDRLPFSAVSRLHQRCAGVEKSLRRAMPMSVWTRVGKLDLQGRGKLALVAEVLREWYRAQESWEATEPMRKRLEARFKELRTEAASLRLPAVPSGQDLRAWAEVAAASLKLASLADQAAGAWAKRQRREQVEAALSALAKEGLNSGAGVPLREAWARQIGSGFLAALGQLAQGPTVEALSAARTAAYTGAWGQLTGTWQRLAEIQRLIDASRKDIALIPSAEDRMQAWWQERPVGLPVELTGGNRSWPDCSQYETELGVLEAWCGRCEVFEESTQPGLSASAAAALELAAQRLQHAAELAPETETGRKARQLVSRVVGAQKASWDTAKLQKAFGQFGAEMLQAQAEGLAARLGHIAFQQAKTHWLQRLKQDGEAVAAVDDLEQELKKHHLVIPASAVSTFQKALRVVPIWITTALASRSIPLEPDLFDVVVVDEASQCTLTNLLPLIYRGKSLVVIGDKEQLPAIPTVQGAEEEALAIKHGVEAYQGFLGHFGNDLYSTTLKLLPRQRGDAVFLTDHFRSHPLIIGFSNRHVYMRGLKLCKPPRSEVDLPLGTGVHAVRVHGAAQQGPGGRSWRNQQEAAAVLEQVKSLKGFGSSDLSVGVVTPFAAQKDLLTGMLQAEGLISDVLVDTANGFQGDERDVIVFSPVVAAGITPSASQWVETPPNLINVALTRAREALIVVGDLDYCSQQRGLLRQLARYCSDIELLRRTSPAELELFGWMTMEGWAPRVHTILGDMEVDFTLEGSGHRLAIEVDGRDHHSGSTQQDAGRDAALQAKGWDVLRVPARDVLQTPFDVLHRIRGKIPSTISQN
jgi:very-short-patch-repair endonuclease